MPKFKNIKSGKEIEVSEIHAMSVVRPQGRYEEIIELKRVPSKKKKAKKKTKKVDKDAS